MVDARNRTYVDISLVYQLTRAICFMATHLHAPSCRFGGVARMTIGGGLFWRPSGYWLPPPLLNQVWNRSNACSIACVIDRKYKKMTKGLRKQHFWSLQRALGQNPRKNLWNFIEIWLNLSINIQWNVKIMKIGYNIFWGLVMGGFDPQIPPPLAASLSTVYSRRFLSFHSLCEYSASELT